MISDLLKERDAFAYRKHERFYHSHLYCFVLLVTKIYEHVLVESLLPLHVSMEQGWLQLQINDYRNQVNQPKSEQSKRSYLVFLSLRR